MEKIHDFNNVYLDKNSDRPFEEIGEAAYYLNVLKYLKALGKEQFESRDFYFYFKYQYSHNNIPASALIKGNRPKVLIFLCEQFSSIPTPLQSKYEAIFKSYLPHDKEINNIYPIPIGCSLRVVRKPILSVAHRKYNVFFVGRLTHIRKIGLYRSLCILKKLPTKIIVRLPQKILQFIGYNLSRQFKDSLILFSNQATQRIDEKTYTEYLNNSKIAFCPRGILSSETPRLFEAMRAGCVVIAEKLPDTYLYRHSPIIQVDSNWAEGIKIARHLLASPKKLKQIQKETILWWKKHFSEKAIANYMLEHLENKPGSKQNMNNKISKPSKTKV